MARESRSWTAALTRPIVALVIVTVSLAFVPAAGAVPPVLVTVGSQSLHRRRRSPRQSQTSPSSRSPPDPTAQQTASS